MKSKGIKLEYEAKYLREREVEMGRRGEMVVVEYGEYRLRAEQ